jgi:tetratricopeptide (TPR) repeat protein
VSEPVRHETRIAAREKNAGIDSALRGHLAGVTDQQIGGVSYVVMMTHPVTWALAFFVAEGAVRLCAGTFSESVVGTLPVAFVDWMAGKLDEGLKEERIAEEICPNSGDAQREAGQILILKKDYAGAIADLKVAEEVLPSDWKTHDLYGQALLANGNANAAVEEFKQALALNPTHLDTEIRLAQALEKKGDWVAAMQHYQKAAAADATIDLRTRVTYSDSLNPAKEYEIGKARFDGTLRNCEQRAKARKPTG